MDMKRAFLGSIVTVAIFAVVYNYFMTTIQVAIAADLATFLATLPFTIGVTAVILGIVGLVSGIIGGVISKRESLLAALVLTAILAIGVAVGNFVYQNIGINALLTGTYTPAEIADHLQNYAVVSLSTFGAGIAGMEIGVIIGGLISKGE
ncbi:MAG: hypothetical protein ACTSUV_03925 [Candidatus Ranarchaeia archaeon]